MCVERTEIEKKIRRNDGFNAGSKSALARGMADGDREENNEDIWNQCGFQKDCMRA